MKKIIQAVVAVVVIANMTGCAMPGGNISTATWHTVVNVPDQALREFNAKPHLYKGVYLGIVKRPGITDPWDRSQVTQDMEYYDLRFAGPLQGRDRTLQILTPVRLFENSSWNPNGIAKELREPMPHGRPAFLYLGDLSASMKTSDVKAVFAKTYGVPIGAWDEYPVLLETRTDIDLPVMDSGQSITLAYPFNLNGRFYVLSPVMLDVKRVIRSRSSALIRPIIGCVSLVITIPLDIVTSPIQFVVWAKDFK